MTDPFESLREPVTPVDPDVGFAAALRRRLERAVFTTPGGTMPQQPTAAVQGTVRAIWETHGLDRETAQRIGWHYTRIGNPIGKAQVSRATFVKPRWRLR